MFPISGGLVRWQPICNLKTKHPLEPLFIGTYSSRQLMKKDDNNHNSRKSEAGE
jgi:hypothetical protein